MQTDHHLIVFTCPTDENEAESSDKQASYRQNQPSCERNEPKTGEFRCIRWTQTDTAFCYNERYDEAERRPALSTML